MKKQNRYRNRISKSLFESEDTHTILSNLGNPLTALDNLIDFEMFRPELEAALSNKERKSNAGRKPFEPVLMFKVLFYNATTAWETIKSNTRLLIGRASASSLV